MRRQFWYGVLVGTFLSIGLGVGTNYSSHHPHTLPGRTLTTVCQVSAEGFTVLANFSLAMADYSRQSMPTDPSLSDLSFQVPCEPQPLEVPSGDTLPLEPRPVDQQRVELIKSMLLPTMPKVFPEESLSKPTTTEPAPPCNPAPISPKKSVSLLRTGSPCCESCPSAAESCTACKQSACVMCTAADAFLFGWMHLLNLTPLSNLGAATGKCHGCCESATPTEAKEGEESEALQPGIRKLPKSDTEKLPSSQLHQSKYQSADLDESEESEPASPGAPSKNRRRTDIDTMEFRPSDAQPDEFESNPI